MRRSRRLWLWLGRSGALPCGFLLGVTLLGLCLWHWQTIRRWDTQREAVSDALVQTQRLAWAATLSPSDDPIIRTALLESKQRLSQLFSVLLNGGRLEQTAVKPLPPQLQSDFAEAARWWFRIERAATSIASVQADATADPRLRKLRDSVERFAARYEAWADPKRPEDGSTPLQALAPPNALALNTAVLVEKLSHMLTSPGAVYAGSQRLGEPTRIPALLERIQQQVDMLLNGEPALGIKPSSGTDRDKLQSFRSELSLLVSLTNGVRETLPALAESIEAGRIIAVETESLRRQLNVLLKRLNDVNAPLRWLLIFTNLVLLGLLELARAQYAVHAARREAETLHGEALQTLQATLAAEQAFDLKREGAASALKGVLAALQQTAESTQRATEQAAVGVQQQANQLRASGQAVLRLAHAFHSLSSESTEAIKSALQAQQTRDTGQQPAEDALREWDGLRDDVRQSAAGMRRAGVASRELSEALASLPEEVRALIEPMVQTTREALRDAVGGLAAGTQRIGAGQRSSRQAATVLSQNQAGMDTLLERLERCAGSSAVQAEIALNLAKILITTPLPTPSASASEQTATDLALRHM